MATADQTSPTMPVSDKQFGMAAKKRRTKTDPHNPSGSKKGKFSGGPAGKKTMPIDPPHLPKPPEVHPHRKHAAKRTRRAH